jgi:phage shock protein PspC (stress-responsive transcriptional regulator)
MKETIKINLNQRLFDLDADAYELLKKYLDSLSDYFKTSDQSADEILQDIEQRIAEIIEEKLKGNKQVVTLQDVGEIIKMMGTIDDFAREAEPLGDEQTERESNWQSTTSEYYSKEHRKLFRDMENNILGGVCSGIAAYFNIDPVWIRLTFVILFFINLVGLIAYLILWVIVPPAITTAQRLQMRGRPVTIENIQESVKSEFHKVKDNFKRYTHSESFRRTRNSANEVLSTLGDIFLVLLKVILIVIGVGLLVAFVAIAFGFLATFMVGANWHFWHFPHLFIREHISPLLYDFTLLTCALFVVVLIPAIAILTGIIKLVFNIRGHNSILSAFAWTIWALALVFVIISFISGEHVLSFTNQKKDMTILDVDRNKTLYIDLDHEKIPGEDIDYYTILGKEIIKDKNAEICYISPTFAIEPSNDDKTKLALLYRTVFPSFSKQYDYDRKYKWYLNDTILLLDHYMGFDEEAVWRFPGLFIILYLPEGQQISIDTDVAEIATGNRDENVWPKWHYNTPMTMKDGEMMNLNDLSESSDNK